MYIYSLPLHTIDPTKSSEINTTIILRARNDIIFSKPELLLQITTKILLKKAIPQTFVKISNPSNSIKISNPSNFSFLTAWKYAHHNRYITPYNSFTEISLLNLVNKCWKAQWPCILLNLTCNIEALDIKETHTQKKKKPAHSNLVNLTCKKTSK